MIPAFAAVPKAKAVDHARCQRHDVLQRAGELHADDVGVRVDPEPIRRQDRCELRRQLGILRRNDRRGRLARGDLPRQIGSRQCRDAAARQLIGDDFGHAQVRALLDPLDDRQQRRVCDELRAESNAGCAQVCRGDGEDEEAVRLGEIGVIGHDAEVRREDDPGQVSLVGALVRQASPPSRSSGPRG